MDRLISIGELGQLKAVSVDTIVGRRRDEGPADFVEQKRGRQAKQP
ncbi:MAG: hypothetical protein RLZZ338_3545 [Cyanobacteriota bacterium]